MLVGVVVLGNRRALPAVRAGRGAADGRPRRSPSCWSRRGAHQVGDLPVALLAARRHGGADPGERLPARRGDGEGRRLPGRPADARVRRLAGWRPTVVALGLLTMLLGGLARAARERPQAHPRLRHGQPARASSPSWSAPAAATLCGRAGDAGARTRCSRPRCSSSSASSTTPPAPATSASSPWLGTGSRPLRSSPSSRLRRWPALPPSSASSPRRRSSSARRTGRRSAPRRLSCWPGMVARLGAHRRLQPPFHLGRVRAEGPPSRAPGAEMHRAADLFLGAPGVARRRRPGARARGPPARQRARQLRRHRARRRATTTSRSGTAWNCRCCCRSLVLAVGAAACFGRDGCVDLLAVGYAARQRRPASTTRPCAAWTSSRCG